MKKLQFRWKVEQFFLSFLVSNQRNVSNNWWKSPASPWELLSTCAENLFENKTIFLSNMVFFRLFVAQSGKELNFWRAFFHTADKNLRFASPEHKFDVFSNIFHFFQQITSFENELFPLLAQNVRPNPQKSTLRAQMIIWLKIGYPRKSITVFLSLWVFKRKCAGFLSEKIRYGYQKCIVNAKKTILEWNTLYNQNNICQISPGIRLQTVLTLTTISCTVVETSLYVSRTPSSHFFE